MKQAVMYGAGNIGRGFIGQLLHMSGYEITFVDVNPTVLERLQADGAYNVYVTGGDHYLPYRVTGVRGVNGTDATAVAEAIAAADVMATAVGVNVLPYIAAPLAGGIRRRMELGVTAPLNVIVCENKIEADRYLAGLIKEHLSPTECAYFDTHVALIEPSIGRMVPATPASLSAREPLAVCVEPYCELPVDRDAFLGEIPPIANLVPFSPFDFHIRRKLFMHNMSHALTAYLGSLRGYTYIWEAIADKEIRALVRAALLESATALANAYKVPMSELSAFAEELIVRYENRLLGDTVLRVGRDSARKLARGDRFMGATSLCDEQGVVPTHILIGVAAGLLFAPTDDAASCQVASAAQSDLLGTLSTLCGLAPDSPHIDRITQLYRAFLEHRWPDLCTN